MPVADTLTMKMLACIGHGPSGIFRETQAPARATPRQTNPSSRSRDAAPKRTQAPARATSRQNEPKLPLARRRAKTNPSSRLASRPTNPSPGSRGVAPKRTQAPCSRRAKRTQAQARAASRQNEPKLGLAYRGLGAPFGQGPGLAK